MKKLLPLMAAILIASCSGNANKEEADELVNEASQQMEMGEYAKALMTVDSIKKTFPDNVEARRQALAIHQEASLKLAQEDLAHTDSLMAIVNSEYSQLKLKVDEDRKAMKATYEETEKLNQTKARLDSLKVRFDMQCAKIKYIHKKQKE